MDRDCSEKKCSTEACEEYEARGVFLKIRETLRYSQKPSFSDQQVAFLEDLIVNNLLSIMVYSRNGRQCSECFGVVDRVFDRIRCLRG
jgi:hypothetical protein